MFLKGSLLLHARGRWDRSSPPKHAVGFGKNELQMFTMLLLFLQPFQWYYEVLENAHMKLFRQNALTSLSV